MLPVRVYTSVANFLIVALIVAASCWAIQNSSLAVLLFPTEKTYFTKTSPNKWTASTAELPNGSYYVSVGRPRSLCELRIDGKIVESTIQNISGLRSKLMLGFGFTKSPENPSNDISIQCFNDGGFLPGLTHKPVVIAYAYGMTLQLWRSVTELLLGLFGSVLLLLSLLSTISNDKDLKGSNRNLYFFAFSALVYSLSLAHFPRLFLNGFYSSFLHMELRCFFSLSFYLFLSQYSRRRTPILFAHFTIAAGYFITAFFFGDRLEYLYDRTIPLYVILSAICAIDLYRTEVKTRSSLYINYLAMTWVIVQLNDTFSLVTNFGAYMAPTVVAVLTAVISRIRLFEASRSMKINATYRDILQLINSTTAVDAKLKDVGTLALSHTSFDRVSVYADAYVLGAHDVPGSRLIRVTDHGYSKNVEQDKIIEFSEGRGEFMRAALIAEKPMLARNPHTGAIFCNIPMGKHAILNFSNEQQGDTLAVYESYDLLERITPALSSISDELATFGARLGYALETLRLIRGDGEWNEELGSIFLDVNDFDDSVQLHKEPYSKFVTRTYLPALCQRVRNWVVREGNSAGDSIYLLCIKDLMKESVTISEGLYHATLEILRFVQGEGAEMCRAQGFDPIQVQVGISSGIATVVCDSFQVRSAGPFVNEASRLQKAAKPGTILVSDSLCNSWPKDGELYYEEPLNEIKKTRRLVGRQVKYIKKPSRAA